MKNSLKVFSVIICGLALISSVCLIYAVSSLQVDAFYKFEVICDVVALIFAFIYFILGFKKDFATYYKIAMYVNALNALVATAVASNEAIKYFAIIFCTIVYGCIFALAISKNLGKNVSIGLCVVITLIRISGVVSYYATRQVLDITVHIMLSQLVLALVILVATICKYEDKNSRGTK